MRVPQASDEEDEKHAVEEEHLVDGTAREQDPPGDGEHHARDGDERESEQAFQRIAHNSRL